MLQVAWLIPLLPFIAFWVILFRGRRLPGEGAYVAIGALGLSGLLSLVILGQVMFGGRYQATMVWAMMGDRPLAVGYAVDPLTAVMLFVVTVVGSLIFIYSVGYMHGDPRYPRFFAYLSLFAASMLLLVLANNFLVLYAGWELVGLCSYLLIGFWFERPAAARASMKAFVTTRVGDFFMFLGILLLFFTVGSLQFDAVFAAVQTGSLAGPLLTLAAVLIFGGAVGKSAQIPLHVWLPDAMEGPTPVSALIHAATMVAAGVYMLVRVGFIIQASQAALLVIAWIGTITAMLAALIATEQSDIKRILAYSTLSQLGYMVMAVGLASNEAAMFHLFTHAFFKALLFLAAGSVIVMLHHEQNIWKMGGLSRNLPITFLTFGAGALALIGCPPFSGFFSKDAILAVAYERNMPIFVVGLLTAFLTAFYVIRFFVVVFFGNARSEIARKSNESPAVMTGPLIVLALLAILGGFAFFARNFLVLPVEKNIALSVPALAIIALVLGSGLAITLYRNRKSEPFDIELFRRLFYFNEFYSWLINWTQELLARIYAFCDRWIIDAGVVGGTSGGTWGIGALLRLIQGGNLQAYLFLFGLGIVALIYFAVFH